MTTSERIQLTLGQLMMENAALAAKVEELEKRVKDLEKTDEIVPN